MRKVKTIGKILFFISSLTAGAILFSIKTLAKNINENRTTKKSGSKYVQIFFLKEKFEKKVSERISLEDNIDNLFELRKIIAKPFSSKNFNLNEDGFEKIDLDAKFLNKLSKAKKIVNRLPDRDLSEKHIEYLASKSPIHVEKWIVEYFNKRNSGAKHASKAVQSGINYAHEDYCNLQDSYDILCKNQESYKHKLKCPSPDKLKDAINIWIPTEDSPIKDWPLDFIKRSISDNETAAPRLNSYVSFKEDMKIFYADPMKWGDAYLFKSYGVFHSSFQLHKKENHIRKSMNIRCLLFEH